MSEVARTLNAELRRRFKPYPAYKDSGVEWLGEIPAHWEVKRVSELMTLVNGFPFDSEHFVRGDGVPLVRIRDLYATETEVNYTGLIAENAWIETGDVIIGMDGDFNVGRWRGPRALLNQRMCCLRARSGTNAGFVTYLLPAPLKVINDLTYSTTVKHLSSNDVRKIRLGSPREPEQRAIAAFLDRETARIDALLAKKERLIALLQEQRTALITRAVTKGLDPTVPMKDSGVEWLGEIPAHWELLSLKRAAAIKYGLGEPPQLLGDGLPFVRATNVSRGRIVDRDMQFVDPEDVPWNRDPGLRTGDIIVVRSGAYTGDSAIIPDKYDGAIAGYDMVVRARRGGPRFLAWALLSRYVLEAQIELESMRAAQPHLNAEELGTVAVLFPSDSEQASISAFLDQETARIDALVAKVRDAIERIKEFRTALISAGVTGKIDVREEVA